MAESPRSPYALRFLRGGDCVYRILIVEDEPNAAAALRDAIRRYGDEHAEQFQVGWMRNTIDLD